MKRFLNAVFLLFAGILLSGCATDNQANKLALLDAIASAGAKCKGEPGCIATLNAAIYSGAINQQDSSSVPAIAAALFPYARLGLDIFNIVYGAGGGGQGFVLNRSNNNTFIGFNKQSADRSSTINAAFDATASAETTQSWENMYNPTTNRDSYNPVTK